MRGLGRVRCSRLEGVLAWLPLGARSANSPLSQWEEIGGRVESRRGAGAAAARRCAAVLLASYAEWESFVERFVDLGLADGYTRFWWDVRPHPRFGTLEIRVPDQPTSVEVTGAFAALLQALCKTVVEEPPPRPTQRGDYAQNRWAALRFGPRAELIHPDGDRVLPVPELAYELLALIEPAVRELGSVEQIRALDPRRCEADRQLEVARGSGLEAVAADVAERTVRSP
jgi:carboxylate-amine ligase